jgi:class 3 adenylate cyclase/cold shock CspA family protein
MTELRHLRDTFAAPDSRRECTVTAIDMIGSTAAKEKQPQAAWLNSLGWLYDTVTEIATEAMSDVVIKYLGDGIMLVCDADQATDAVNAVIRIQEAIEKAGRGTGGGKGVVDFAVSCGVAVGEVVGFTTPDGNRDFVGTVVDKAFRLCAAASAKAIFVDTQTLGAANTIRITSTFGRAVNRTSDEYQGDVQRAMLKGFNQPVTYHEILWDQQLYGVKSSTVTASTERLRSVPAAATGTGGPGTVVTAGIERHRGEVVFWRADKDFGFIRDPQSDEQFYVSSKTMVYVDDVSKLSPGREVVFVAAGETDGARKRQAGAVLVVGEPADGPLVSVPVNKTYGWIRVEDSAGNRHLIFVPADQLAGHTRGEVLGFTAGATEKGACARDVERVEDEAA